MNKTKMMLIARMINRDVFKGKIDLSNVIFKPLNFLEAYGISLLQFDSEFTVYGVTLKMHENDVETFVGICNDTYPLKPFDIILHELIHVWQLQHGFLNMGHSKEFLYWCEKACDIYYPDILK